MHLHPVSPTQSTLLMAWDWRLDAVLVLGSASLLYLIGWRRLRRRGRQQLATGWRLASYLGGIAALALALMSAIDTLQERLFFVHMIQHLLLAMVAPPLLWLGSPLPIGLWGLPARLRRPAGLLLSRQSPLRHALRASTPPFVVWMLYMATLWGWHDPAAYDAALRVTWLHDLEHLSFFTTGMLFWWHVTAAAPRIHRPFAYGPRVLYVLLTFFLNMGPSVAITMAGQPIYSYYTEVPRLWGISALQDQRIGGLIMWIPGGMMYAMTALILIIRLLREGERPSPRREEAASGAKPEDSPLPVRAQERRQGRAAP